MSERVPEKKELPLLWGIDKQPYTPWDGHAPPAEPMRFEEAIRKYLLIKRPK